MAGEADLCAYESFSSRVGAVESQWDGLAAVGNSLSTMIRC